MLRRHFFTCDFFCKMLSIEWELNLIMQKPWKLQKMGDQMPILCIFDLKKLIFSLPILKVRIFDENWQVLYLFLHLIIFCIRSAAINYDFIIMTMIASARVIIEWKIIFKGQMRCLKISHGCLLTALCEQNWAKKKQRIKKEVDGSLHTWVCTCSLFNVSFLYICSLLPFLPKRSFSGNLRFHICNRFYFYTHHWCIKA